MVSYHFSVVKVLVSSIIVDVIKIVKYVCGGKKKVFSLHFQYENSLFFSLKNSLSSAEINVLLKIKIVGIISRLMVIMSEAEFPEAVFFFCRLFLWECP